MSANVTITPSRSLVVFNSPIDIELAAPIPPPRGELWDHKQIGDYVANVRLLGFDEGGIVVRRSLAIHDQKRPNQWGVITNLQTYRGNTTIYTPLTVKWFTDSPLSFMWHDELVMIHRAMEWNARQAFFTEANR